VVLLSSKAGEIKTTLRFHFRASDDNMRFNADYFEQIFSLCKSSVKYINGLVFLQFCIFNIASYFAPSGGAAGKKP
jgi:hypothetical protein